MNQHEARFLHDYVTYIQGNYTVTVASGKWYYFLITVKIVKLSGQGNYVSIVMTLEQQGVNFSDKTLLVLDEIQKQSKEELNLLLTVSFLKILFQYLKRFICVMVIYTLYW